MLFAWSYSTNAHAYTYSDRQRQRRPRSAKEPRGAACALTRVLIHMLCSRRCVSLPRSPHNANMARCVVGATLCPLPYSSVHAVATSGTWTWHYPLQNGGGVWAKVCQHARAATPDLDRFPRRFFEQRSFLCWLCTSSRSTTIHQNVRKNIPD